MLFTAADEVSMADAALHLLALGDDQLVVAAAVRRVKGNLNTVKARSGQRV